METEINLDLPDLSNLHVWTIHRLLKTTPPTIDVRMTTLKTDDGIDVLMMIAIDDKQN
jgi:hypothetical protein